MRKKIKKIAAMVGIFGFFFCLVAMSSCDSKTKPAAESASQNNLSQQDGGVSPSFVTPSKSRELDRQVSGPIIRGLGPSYDHVQKQIARRRAGGWKTMTEKPVLRLNRLKRFLHGSYLEKRIWRGGKHLSRCIIREGNKLRLGISNCPVILKVLGPKECWGLKSTNVGGKSFMFYGTEATDCEVAHVNTRASVGKTLQVLAVISYGEDLRYARVAVLPQQGSKQKYPWFGLEVRRPQPRMLICPTPDKSRHGLVDFRFMNPGLKPRCEYAHSDLSGEWAPPNFPPGLRRKEFKKIPSIRPSDKTGVAQGKFLRIKPERDIRWKMLRPRLHGKLSTSTPASRPTSRAAPRSAWYVPYVRDRYRATSRPTSKPTTLPTTRAQRAKMIRRVMGGKAFEPKKKPENWDVMTPEDREIFMEDGPASRPASKPTTKPTKK